MRARSMEANNKPVATQTIVVAAKSLRFGAELNASVLKEMPWPEQPLPAGAFHKIKDILSGGELRPAAPFRSRRPRLR